jgi:AcrR family transcriptional regulator
MAPFASDPVKNLDPSSVVEIPSGWKPSGKGMTVGRLAAPADGLTKAAVTSPTAIAAMALVTLPLPARDPLNTLMCPSFLTRKRTSRDSSDRATYTFSQGLPRRGRSGLPGFHINDFRQHPSAPWTSVYDVHLSHSFAEEMRLAKQAVAGRRSRSRLSREHLLGAAVALADESGIDSLSMRRLAHEFGVVPMALYKHVANKEDLLDGMVDVVFGEIDLPSRETDWKTALRQRALSTRQVLLRHRWAIGLLESRLEPGDANLRHHDSVLGCLRGANFSIEMAIHAYSVLDSYIYGFALQEQALPFDGPETIGEVADAMLSRFPANEYPYLKETIAEQFNRTGWEYADEFEFGLDLILDGLEKLQKRRSSPTAN